MTLTLPAQHVTDPECRLNWDQVAALLPAGVTWGAGTLTWPGGQSNTNTLTVTHGLVNSAHVGVTPTAVLATVGPGSDAGLGSWGVVRVSAIGASTFLLSARTNDNTMPANGTTCPVYWLAVA